jgi:HEAT repeat protein
VLIRDWRYSNRHEAVLEALVAYRELAVGPLIAALKDEGWEVRKRVVSALEQIGEVAVEPLIAALTDDDISVRNRVGLVLGKIGDPRPGVGVTTNARGEAVPDCMVSGEGREISVRR